MFRIQFDRKCNACDLTCGQAVAGQSNIPLDRVLLIIISSYPGISELQQNLSLVDSKSRNNINTGAFLRMLFKAVFDADKSIPDIYKPFENFVYFTNAVKCSPSRGRDKLTIKPSHIAACKDIWLSKELNELSNCPMLLASSEAVTAMLGKDKKLNTSRNTIHTVGDRKAVVTHNPTEWGRGAIKVIKNKHEIDAEVDRLIEHSTNPHKSIDRLIKEDYWKPTPYGSTLWFVKQDLETLKTLVKEYIDNKEKRT
jgi:uracil-DNA glycosylase